MVWAGLSGRHCLYHMLIIGMWFCLSLKSTHTLPYCGDRRSDRSQVPEESKLPNQCALSPQPCILTITIHS
jgi:hypothetical protein